MAKGYHYTTLINYRKIEVEGLLPTQFDGDFLVETRDTEGIWLFREPQENEQLFGVLIDCFARHYQTWLMVELEVDFEIKDCIKALDERDALKVLYNSSIEDWVYHKDEPIVIIRKKIWPSQIQLLQKFNLIHAIRSSDHLLIRR